MSRKHIRVEKIVSSILIFVVFWLLISGIWFLWRQSAVKTMVLGANEDELYYDAYGFIPDAQSYLLYPQTDGIGTPVRQQGERVAKNYAVYMLTTLDENGKANEPSYAYAPVSGIVSYDIDGYESVQELTDVQQWDIAALYQEQTDQQKQQSEGKDPNISVRADVPFAKIVNNLSALRIFCAIADKDYAQSLQNDEMITLIFPTLDCQATGRIVQCIPRESDWLVEINLGQSADKLYLSRLLLVKIPCEQQKEITIPLSAIVQQDGKNGVYCVKKKFVFWESVEILAVREDSVVVDNAWEGTEIVLNPKHVSEGKYIR